MNRLFLVVTCWLLVADLKAQTVAQKLQKSFAVFEKDTQLSHAISSLYVIDAATGKVVFDKNSQTGLAPASTQKIIISVTAFELLGKNYRYKTELGRNSSDDSLFIINYGDPTFGSWRYKSTVDTVVLNELSDAVSKEKIRSVNLILIPRENEFSVRNTPDGWIWQDIGNYYGASPFNLNWRENQYDLILKSGDILGSGVEIVKTNPDYYRNESFINYLHSAEKGSGDNAYIYLKDGHHILTGTIPVGEKAFSISGSVSDPSGVFYYEFLGNLLEKKIRSSKGGISVTERKGLGYPVKGQTPSYSYKVFYTHYSPTLDSIIYWFNKKSINLYGEALVKTFAYEKQGYASTDSGVAIVKRFWKEKGVDENELNIFDGSGLSPLNRITTHAQVEILKYAKTKDWFPYFFDALPEYNGMKMKSGTIRDVKGFCGYQKAKDGKEYIFSFLVNNYNDSAGELVKKMYKVLDNLK